jgi:hypothetical protein
MEEMSSKITAQNPITPRREYFEKKFPQAPCRTGKRIHPTDRGGRGKKQLKT